MNLFEEGKGLVRPLVTVVFAVTICTSVFLGLNLPDWFVAMASSTITFWYVQRTK